jgi:hypothetical protein
MVYFLQDWIVNQMLNLLKRTMTYPVFEPGTFWSSSQHTEPLHYLGRRVGVCYSAILEWPGLICFDEKEFSIEEVLWVRPRKIDLRSSMA